MMSAMQRRHAMGALVGCSAALWQRQPLADLARTPTSAAWPAWARFQAQFLSADGRVIDPDSPRSRTVSEGQAYALFFALVANDRAAFERVLHWTEDNLCQGDLGSHLPAWHWGRQDSGQWGVLDSNSASDADLWLAYTLGEAGRLWQERRYQALSVQLSARMVREESADLPGLGPTLLPGTRGFTPAPGRWRLNASYGPPQLMAWMARYAGAAVWERLAESSLKLTLGSSPKGFCSDWTVYDAQHGFLPEPIGGGKGHGSYDAIRVYLWAGTLHPKSGARTILLSALRPMAQLVRESAQVPEAVNAQTGQPSGVAPPGLVAAMLPFLQAQQDRAALQQQRARLKAQPLRANAYYEQALGLFALGWLEGYYRYGRDGELQPRWSKA